MFEISEDTVDDPELCWAYVFFKQNLTMATAMFALQLQQLPPPAQEGVPEEWAPEEGAPDEGAPDEGVLLLPSQPSSPSS